MAPKIYCFQDTEYGLAFMLRGAGVERPKEGELIRLLLEYGAKHSGGQQAWMDPPAFAFANGGFTFANRRPGDDREILTHPVWATPECYNPTDLTRYDQAGDIMLARTGLSLQQELNSNDVDVNLMLVKNSGDSLGQTFGCHECYTLHRPFSYADLGDLVPFLVTRQILCASGTFTPQHMPDHWFQLSQRSIAIESVIRVGYGKPRPIIRLGEGDQVTSFQVAIGDSNMHDTSTFLRVGTTMLVAYMVLTLGRRNGFQPLLDPLASLRAVSHDLSVRTPLPFNDGREASPLAIQQRYLEMARDVFGGQGWPGQVIQEWERTLHGLQYDRRLLLGRIDWVTKLELLQKRLDSFTTLDRLTVWLPILMVIESGVKSRLPTQARDVRVFLDHHLAPETFDEVSTMIEERGLRWNDLSLMRQGFLALQQLDLLYHDLLRPRGGARADSFGLVRNLIADSALAEAFDYPPQHPRPQARAALVALAKQSGVTTVRVAREVAEIKMHKYPQKIRLPDGFADHINLESWLDTVLPRPAPPLFSFDGGDTDVILSSTSPPAPVPLGDDEDEDLRLIPDDPEL